MGMDDLKIRPDLVVPAAELEFHFSRSSGPGGQHVNTTSSKATLVWPVMHSNILSDAQKQRLAGRLHNRINQEGELQVHSEQHRSQHRNRQACRELMAGLVRDALHVPKKRKPTKPSRAARQKRVDEKKQRGKIKEMRKKPKY